MKRAATQRQLFLIGADLLNSLSVEEIEATYADMVEMGIAQPPYTEFDIRMPLWAYAKSLGRFLDRYNEEYAKLERERRRLVGEGEPAKIDLVELSSEQKDTFAASPFDLNYSFTFGTDGRSDQQWFMSLHGRASNKHPVSSPQTADRVLMMFVVLLATRNVTRDVKINKLAKLGIGKNSYSKTTTLRIGEVTETSGEQTGLGVHRRPHLRRGHIRRQKYGPGFQFEKKIFVQAVFVNADDGWIAERTAYNVSRAEPPLALANAEPQG
jgi:hypothetical protein